ncbi:thioredoxin [Halorussus pelagicus]|uniref:thioredoxin n=1 Tax=Halorussus pelagicus TaxID=2505977 RepID=UPI000FFB90C3|nr:thioredoxin [Halorussus pelagicus]
MSEDEPESIREQQRDEPLGEESKEGERNKDSVGASAADAEAETKTKTNENAPTEPVHVESVEQFSSVTTEYGVVLVDFYADWCGPCNMLEPTLEAVARQTDAAVAKVDIDEQQGLAAQYGVRSVPTLLLFADGEQVEQLVGVQDEVTLTRLIERYS